MEYSALLKHLIAFDTTSHRSNLALVDYVVAYLEQYDVTLMVDYNESKSKANILAQIGDNPHSKWLLSGHTDVVPVSGQDWDTDPFILHHEQGKFYGRGTADMKGFIAVVLSMVPEFCALPYSTHLCFSYDEEIGCLGVDSLIELFQQKQCKTDLAIIGEPTMMRLCHAHKGIFRYDVTITGKAAHSSCTHLGNSAILIAGEFLHQLNLLKASFETSQDTAFTPPYTSLQVGLIEGGTAENIIPNYCRFTLEIRPLPHTDMEGVDAKIRSIATQLAAEYHTEIMLDPMPSVRGLIPETIPYQAELIAEYGEMVSVSYGTEAGKFQIAAMPAMVCGPGSIEQAHRANEFVTESQLNQCQAFLTHLMQLQQ